MTITHTALFVILIILLIGAIPRWPHSKTWGYIPSVILSAILIALFFNYIIEHT